MDLKETDKPSRRMLKTWAKRISGGTARTVPVYVGGNWSLQVLRGHKRVMSVPLDINSKDN